MHSEHLQNVGMGRVIAGWLVAIAVTSLLLLSLTALGWTDAASETTWWSMIAVVVGFFAGGFFSGFRAMQAPVLHGIAIGLTTLIAWVLINAVVFGALGYGEWEGMTPTFAVTVVLAQIAAATVGALMGYNLALRGKPGLSEHEPLAD